MDQKITRYIYLQWFLFRLILQLKQIIYCLHYKQDFETLDSAPSITFCWYLPFIIKESFQIKMHRYSAVSSLSLVFISIQSFFLQYFTAFLPDVDMKKKITNDFIFVLFIFLLPNCVIGFKLVATQKNHHISF